jgi:hypothetical protein
MVHHEHAMRLRELRDLEAPVREVARIAVYEHVRLAAVAVPLVVDADAVDVRVWHDAHPLRVLRIRFIVRQQSVAW